MNSVVSYCGCFGVTGTGNNHFIYNNTFSFNNNGLYDVDRQSAGVKVVSFSNSIIMKNTFSNNYAPGLWLDEESDSNQIIQNATYNNCIAGIEVEISKSNVLVNNVAYKNRVPVRGNYKVPNDKGNNLKGFQTIDNYYHDYWNNSGNGIWIPTSPYTKLLNNICYANQGAGLRIDGGIRIFGNDSLTTHNIICQKNISVNNEGTQLWIKEDAENIRSDYNIFSDGDTIFRTNLDMKNGRRFTTLSSWQASLQQDLHSVVYSNIGVTDTSKSTITIKDNVTGIPAGDTIGLKWAYGNQSSSLTLGPKAGSYGVSGIIQTLTGTIRLKSDDKGVFIDSTINPYSPCIYSIVVSGVPLLLSGTTSQITWSVDPTVKIDSCIISVSFDNKVNWKPIGKTINTLFLVWFIPKRKSDSVYVKVTAYDYKKNSYSAISEKFSTVIVDDFVLQLQPHTKSSIVASWDPANITIAKKEAFCLAYKKGSIVTSIDESGIDTLMYNLTISRDTISKGFSSDVATYYFTAFVRDTDKKFIVANGNAIVSVVVGETVVPDNPCILGGTRIDSTKVALFWNVNALKKGLFDSIAVWYNEFGYPGKAYDSGAVKAGSWDLQTFSDTIKGLKSDKLYYFSIFGLDSAGVWSKTSDSAKLQIRTGKSIGTTKGYPVIFQGSEVESLFTDTVTIRGEDFSKPFVDTIDRWDIPFSKGFIICGLSFSFRNGTLPAESMLHFGIKYQLPDTLLNRNDIRVYRFNVNTMAWRLDTVKITYDTSGRRLFFSTSEPELPFALMIDTLIPHLSVHVSDTAAYTVKEPLCDTFTIRDNIENLRIKFLASPGSKSFSDFSYFIVSAGTGLYTTTIPAYLADPASGLRAILIVSDGRSSDTINLSRRIVRAGVNCDNTTVQSMEWAPVAVTAQLLKGTMETAFSEALHADSFSYDNREFRIMRWIPTELNSSSASKWVEYTSVTSNDFSFSPGKTIWIKSKNKMALSFDTAVIPSLVDTFNIVLKKGVWNDFSLPYNFDIYAGDIFNATTMNDSGAENIELNEWVKLGSTYSTKPLYLAGIEGASDPGAILNAGSHYIAFNHSDHDITLRIPPVCVPMSMVGQKAGVVKKKVSSQQWSIRLGFRDEKGIELSPVYCAAIPENNLPRYYQSAPTFAPITARIIDRLNKKQFAHAASGDLSTGGTSFTICCENQADQPSAVTATIDKITGLPIQADAVLYFEGEKLGTALSNTSTMMIAAKQKNTGYLIVGKGDYISQFIKSINSVFSFKPFTFNNVLRIRYTLPIEVKKLTTSIFDLKGRCLERIVLKSGLTAGEGLLTLDRRYASGYYVIQMKIETVGKSKPAVLNRRWMFVR
jgi:hypothetical protein